MFNKTIDLTKFLMSLLKSYDFTMTDLLTIRKYLKVHKIRRGEILSRIGEIENNMYFILHGLIGKYGINTRGEEVCINLGYDNNFFNEPKSFYKREPSEIYLRALENSTLISIDYTSYMHLSNTIPAIKRFRCETVERELADLIEKLEYSKLRDKAMQYEWFCKYFSKVITRIPQKDIASYLSITPVHLCRLKKKYHDVNFKLAVLESI